ncbi:MAG: DUF1330 domain-containing protein [Halopseudomonas aestusnigri]
MKAYIILDFTITDHNKFMEYVHEIPTHIKRHQGTYIVEGIKPEAIEGDWHPSIMVILEFPSLENAKEFLNDPEIQPVFAIRHKSTIGKMVLVEGGSWRGAI